MKRMLFLITGLFIAVPASSPFGQINWDAYRPIASSTAPSVAFNKWCDFPEQEQVKEEADFHAKLRANSATLGLTDEHIEHVMGTLRRMRRKAQRYIAQEQGCTLPCDYKRVSPEELQAMIAVSRNNGVSEAKIRAGVAQLMDMEARLIRRLEARGDCQVP